MSQPPAYAAIPVLYDETHRGRWDQSPTIASLGNLAHLFGTLEHHSPATDGTFAICIAGGEGTFISKDLYESIPEAHRPPLRTENKQKVEFLMGSPQETLGTTILPFILTATDGKPFIMKLFMHVLPRMLMGMFIGRSTAPYLTREAWSGGKPSYEFDLNGQVVRVAGPNLYE